MRRSDRTRTAVFGGLVVAGLLVNVCPAPARAQIYGADRSPKSQLFMITMRNNSLERFSLMVTGDFAQMDADGDGKLSQQDVDLHVLMESAQARAAAANAVMKFDVDGDGFVTENEIRWSMKYEMRARLAERQTQDTNPAPRNFAQQEIDNRVKAVMMLDTDKDGKVSYLEATKSADTMRNGFGFSLASRTKIALTLDSAVKGEITAAEYLAAGQALYHKVDADGDGKITQQELTDYTRQQAAVDSGAASASQTALERLRRQSEEDKRRQTINELLGANRGTLNR